MNDYATKYRCAVCQSWKWIPERPSSPNPSIKTGCESCGRLTRQTPQGYPVVLRR